MNDEQLRAEFEAWAQDKAELYKMSNGEYSSRITRFAFEAYQAGRAALQSQPTEAFPCRIVETDFETGTVTLEMQGKYTVSSGQKYLCDAPLYRCPVPKSQVNLDSSNHIPHTGKMAPEGWQPINTAPRDGTRILLHDPNRYRDKTLVGYFARGNFLALTSGIVVTPTHWAPLPATPKKNRANLR